MIKQQPKSRTSKKPIKNKFRFKWWVGLILVVIVVVVGVVVVRLSRAAEPGKVSAQYNGDDGKHHFFSQYIDGFKTNSRKYVKIRNSIYGTADTIPARCYLVEKAGVKNNIYMMTQISGSTCGLFWTNQPSLAWPMDLGRLTQCWGNNGLQGRTITSPSWAGGTHSGLDIGGPASIGTPVKAAASGTVSLVQSTAQSGGYGNFVIIKHDKYNNGFWTAYAHMNSIVVSQGQIVASGQQIGGMGNTGSSTAAHLHFMVQNVGSVTNDSNVPSQNLNPLNFLPRSSAHDEGQCLRT